MSDKPQKKVLGATLRANPNYELVLYDRLPSEQREVLRDITRDPNHYGILRGREQSDLSIKTINRDTALLFFTLQTPGKIPAYVMTTFGDQLNDVITQLILDQVLEMEWEQQFVTGPAAAELLYDENGAGEPETRNHVTRLSLEALRYAQTLDLTDVGKLSFRLYCYNRIPASPAWRRRLATLQAEVEYLGLNEGSPSTKLLNSRWHCVEIKEPNNRVWVTWALRSASNSNLDENSGTYKLYVSPRPESTREAFERSIEVFTELGVRYFKIGATALGLLRPDKMVAYFKSFEEVEKAASALRPELAGCKAQGVPFTAEINGEDGLLSWGIDPPASERLIAWQGRESWRLWITNRLATALLAAKSAKSETLQPWRFALQRLELEGIDTTNWTPAESLWQTTQTVKEI